MTSIDPSFLHEYYEEAIDKWVEVVARKVRPLYGGVSGANVSVVHAEIHFPALEDRFKADEIRVVVKFSAKEDFQLEKDNFQSLPEELKDLFVDFAAPGNRALVRGQYFMVMPHLDKYKTLAQWVFQKKEEKVRSAVQLTTEKLGQLLPEDIEKKKISTKTKSNLLFVYLSDIQDSINRIFSPKTAIFEFVGKFNLDEERIRANGKTLLPYSEYYEWLLTALRNCVPPFVTWTHGDCHSRNIMIDLAKPDFRFIDIDRLVSDGDYASDLGTLISDLEFYHPLLRSRRPAFELKVGEDNSLEYEVESNKSAEFAVRLLKEYAKSLSSKFKDTEFDQRFKLSKIRYLLRMASRTTDAEKAMATYCEGFKTLDELVTEQKNLKKL